MRTGVIAHTYDNSAQSCRQGEQKLEGNPAMDGKTREREKREGRQLTAGTGSCREMDCSCPPRIELILPEF